MIGQSTREWMRQAIIDFENADRALDENRTLREENVRLRKGLSNVSTYARRLQPKLDGMSVKIGGVDMSVFLAALRDYTLEARDGTQVKGRTRSVNTSDCSAASRWGIDFEEGGC